MKNNDLLSAADQMRLYSKNAEDELISSPPAGSGASTAAISTAPHSGMLNAAELLSDMERALAAMPPEPDSLAAYMRAQGFDPARGAKLYVPDTEEMRAHFAPWPPKYVRFGKLLPFPVMGWF
jgi:hypothetical protein